MEGILPVSLSLRALERQLHFCKDCQKSGRFFFRQCLTKLMPLECYTDAGILLRIHYPGA